MHVPTTSPLTNIGPVSSANIAIHELTGISWHVLMPYTALGGVLMIYSQTRLFRGERAMRKQQTSKAKKKSHKAKSQTRWFMPTSIRAYSGN